MLEFFKRGQAARDVRLMAAQGVVEAPANELLEILVVLTKDSDAEVCRTAVETLSNLPADAVQSLLASGAVSDDVRLYFAPESDDDIDDPELLSEDIKVERDSLLQKLAKMNFAQKLKAASKGTREVRAILVRDPSKMISMAVLTSPKLTEPEVEAFARMGNVAEDVLRYIGAKRVWMKNYGIVVALCKNAKTPLGLSLNLMNRLNDRDLQGLSTDRNVPEPLRIAARKKVVSAVSR